MNPANDPLPVLDPRPANQPAYDRRAAPGRPLSPGDRVTVTGREPYDAAGVGAWGEIVVSVHRVGPSHTGRIVSVPGHFRGVRSGTSVPFGEEHVHTIDDA